ncbi:MAG: hypothetical protein J7J85_03180 [Deltaproteobacteria bacterium]|nr:hypothetical protein [Deltaproteobacteria bacterium]
MIKVYKGDLGTAIRDTGLDFASCISGITLAIACLRVPLTPDKGKA